MADEIARREYGLELRRRWKDSGRSTDAIARFISVSQPMVIRYMSGARHPSPERKLQIDAFFATPDSELPKAPAREKRPQTTYLRPDGSGDERTFTLASHSDFK